MILLTGSTGFVGGHLLKRLLASGEKIRCLVRSQRIGLERLRGLPVETASGDLLDPAALLRALEGVDGVIHLAGILWEQGEQRFDRVNAEGTKTLVEVAQEAGIRRVIYLSCLWAHPDPAFPFAFSKWKGEEAVKGSGLPFTILRPSVIFGEGDHFIEVLDAFLRRALIVPLLGSAGRFQPIWAGDVASCILKVLSDEGFIGRTLPLGGPELFSFEQIVDLVLKAQGMRRVKLRLFPFLLHLLPRPALADALLELCKLNAIVDQEIVRRTFGFQPMPLTEGVGYILSRKRLKRIGAPTDASKPTR